MIKKYYIIEPLDIDGDSNPDGILISQYKLDKYNNKIFLKNKYITFLKLNNFIKKGGDSDYHSNKRHHQHYPYHPEKNQNIIILKPEEYNAYMNNKIPPQQLLNNPHILQHQYPPQYHNQYQQQPIILRDNHSNSFGNSFMSGVGGGAGFGISTAIIDALFGE
jgi:hypothetical protein